MKRTEFSRENLMDFLSYNPETGEFYRTKLADGRKLKKPKLAGCFHKGYNKGYIEIEIGSVCYQAHRLAWLFVFGVWPPKELDHINGIRDDNRIVNLRPVTKSQNQHNRKRWVKSTSSKFKGVSFHKLTGKWVAHIQAFNKREHIGLFDTEEAAAKARNSRAEILHGEYARIG